MVMEAYGIVDRGEVSEICISQLQRKSQFGTDENSLNARNLKMKI